MKKYKYILLGAIFGFCLSFTVGAHAEVMNMIGKVVQGEYDFTINNDKLETKAIIVDGVAYIPARLMGEAAGYIVRFDDITGLKLIKKIATPPDTIKKSIDAITKSINTNHAVIKVNENELEQLRSVPQTESTIIDAKNVETRIQKLKDDNIKLNEQISKFDQTLNDIEAQNAEINK